MVSSVLQIACGIAGAILICVLAFFGIRKRWYRSRLGTLQQWLRAHIYLGILVIVVLLFHSGGRFHDRVAVTALVLVAIVVVSGAIGALLYATVPRLLNDVESDVAPEDMSGQLNDLLRQMAGIASSRSPEFQNVYNALARETRPPLFAGWRLIAWNVRRRRDEAGHRSQLLAAVPKDEQDTLREMLVLSRQREELLRRLIVQQRYKNILQAWLYVHVPFTFALLIVAAAHITAVFYYGRIRW